MNKFRNLSMKWFILQLSISGQEIVLSEARLQLLNKPKGFDNYTIHAFIKYLNQVKLPNCIPLDNLRICIKCDRNSRKCIKMTFKGNKETERK